MISANLKSELTWFCAGSVAALFVGALIGLPAITVVLFMAGYTVWVLYRVEKLVSWLRKGAKPSHAPYSHGLTDEMLQLIHREKKYSRKQKNRYRRSLAQFNSLAANLPDAITVLNQDFEIRWSNPAAKMLLNIHPERDRGQRIDNLIRDPAFSEFLNNQDGEIEAEIRGPVSGDRTLAVRLVPSEKQMTVLIAADITQRAKVREMRKTFVADVSHELRTPLTVIRGYLEMLQEHSELQPPVLEAIGEVSLQSDRMRGIVEDLLRLSKLEANPLHEDEGELVNVASMIRRMAAPLRVEAPTHTLITHLDDSIAVLGSERELYSVCNNLLTNAIRYTDEGTTIVITWKHDKDGQASFSVADNGAGIEPRHLSRLSERFYRVDTGRAREQGGTGLGLAIAKHAIQRHGGTLDIASTPGTGSCFTAYFPASRVQALQKIANQ